MDAGGKGKGTPTVQNGVNLANSVDKPQGFINGQMAKRGQYACFMNCGKVFSSIEDAVHQDCPMRKVLDNDVQLLYSMQGLNREEFLKNVEIEQNRNRKRFRKFLKNLPKKNTEDFVKDYIQNLPEPNNDNI